MLDRVSCLAIAVLASFTSTCTFAQEVTDTVSDNETQALQREIIERDNVIRKLINRLEVLEDRVKQIETNSDAIKPPQTAGDKGGNEKLIGTDDQSASKDDGNKTDNDSTTSKTSARIGELAHPNNDRLIKTAFEQTLIERGGLLLPPNVYDLEPSISYVHSSTDKILIDGFAIQPVLVVGDIVSQRVRRDHILFALTGRLGLPNDYQVEIRIPYGLENQRTYSANNKDEIISDSGLGDIEFAISHQLYRSQDKWPDLLGSLRWKTTTGKDPFTANPGELPLGTGYNSYNISLTAVNTVDPVVHFIGLSYSFNAPTTENVGRYQPGDSLGFNLGMAIALNLNNSLSLSYDQQFTNQSKLNGENIPGSYLSTGVFSVGSSYLFSDNLTADFSLGIGVTRDSPDVLFDMSFPFRSKH